MNIEGINPNANIEAFNVKSAAKSTADINTNGPSFAQSISEVARQADLQVAQGATAANLQFTLKKESFDPLFSFQEAEKEFLQEQIERINKLINDLKK